MGTRQVVVEFLGDHTARTAGEELVSEVEKLERAVIATCDDGSPVILGYKGQRVSIYSLAGEAIEMVAHDLRGIRLTTHRKAVPGGLLATKYTLEHPYLPRSGKLQIDVATLDAEDRDALPLELERFLQPG